MKRHGAPAGLPSDVFPLWGRCDCCPKCLFLLSERGNAAVSTDLCAVLHGGVDSGAALQEENTKLTVRSINGTKRHGNVNHVSFSAEE